MRFVLYIILFFSPYLLEATKFLHLSFHKSCLTEIEMVGNELGIEVESKDVSNCSSEEFDGESMPRSGNRYIISKERANKIYDINSYLFSQYDGFIVSDTTPLARIFLQNIKDKPLIIWICNRFDFGITGDIEYYTLFKEALSNPNVQIIGYTQYEAYYVKQKCGVNVDKIIKPTGFAKPVRTHPTHTKVPKNIVKEREMFLPYYFNEKSLKITNNLRINNISFYHGRYQGSDDIIDFKGVIHIPAVMSNFFLFENVANGLIHFIPSKKFYIQLTKQHGFTFLFWHNSFSKPIYTDIFAHCEWYAKEHQNFFVYFDSWEDLAEKIKTTDYIKKSTAARDFATINYNKTLTAWRDVFNAVKTSNQ